MNESDFGLNVNKNLDKGISTEAQLHWASKSNNEKGVIESLSALIKELNEVFISDFVNIEKVHQLMLSYQSNPAEWERFAKFDRNR